MAIPRKSAEERRAELIKATLALLAEVPPERLSTTMIAARLGLSQAALFRHFPSKDALWAAVLTEVEARARAAWDEALAHEETALGRLRALIAAQLRLIAATPALPALIFTPARLSGEDTVRPIHLRVMAELRARLTAQLRAGIEAGALRDDIAPQDATLLLMGLTQGIVLRWSVSGRDFDLVAEGMRLAALQLRMLGASEQEAAR